MLSSGACELSLVSESDSSVAGISYDVFFMMLLNGPWWMFSW